MMVISLILSFVIAVGCFFLRDLGFFYSLGITALTFFTQIALRFICAAIIGLFHFNYDYCNWWFREKKWERPLYKALDIKRLKKNVPTYNPEEFDFEKLSVEEILHNNCHAEVVHEFIAVMSYLPVLYSLRFGALPVFLATSVLASGFDLYFVAVQRYNRPRFVRLMNIKEN